MDIAVSVKNLTKIYKLYEDKWGPIKEVFTRSRLHKEFSALKDVSIDFPKGESIGVLGKNGSGKSTLLKIITGIADPTGGTVDVNGSLVFLDVSSGIDSELTGYDNIFMKGTLLGYSKEEMLEKVDDIIEFSELGEFIHQPVKNYSSGMRSKLGFAISVNVDPDILIVDEALAVGDSQFREKCMDKMNEFKEKGKTIIFVSHDKNAVEAFCSKAAWIHQGELITYGDSKFVGSIYNDFMSGKKTLEAVLSEIQFSHSIDRARFHASDKGISIDLEGYLYDLKSANPISFELVVRDIRTGEAFTKSLDRTPYESHNLPVSIKESAGFSIMISEDEVTSFFKPGRYSFAVRYKNNSGQWTEFPLWAGNAELEEEGLEAANTPFVYKPLKNNNQLVLTVDNHDKVQQQVNRIWIEGPFVHIEGVAFVRGYETDSPDDVSMEFLAVNLETFEEEVYPIELSKTEEITENQSFNPQGKKYNYSRFNVKADVTRMKDGVYECKLIYQMKNAPGYKLDILVWASKHNEYPSAPHQIEDREIDVQTSTKYLKLNVRTVN